MIYLQDFQWQHWRHCSESCTPPPDVSWIYARVTTWRLLFGNCTDWLPVPQRIEFKLCLLVHNLQLGHSPKYLSDMLTLAADRKTLSLVIKLRLLHCATYNSQVRVHNFFCCCSTSLEQTTNRTWAVTFHTTVQVQTENIFIYCRVPELNCKLKWIKLLCPKGL